ncbi:nucleotidyltransferase [Knoellia locipacati]|uniref:SMODS domain-containing nucleotidyltransferase n=1 Tax=Knoellia locipacati TaxID=882824 RepID=UPI00384CA411
MAILTGLFQQALSNIEPSDEDKQNAPKAHKDVSGALGGDDQLVEWGTDPILIGSYKRNVSIQRVKDVDVFCRLNDLPADVGPADLLDHFHEVLAEEFGGDRVDRQARSVKVAFPAFDDLHVDAVPARPRSDGTWEIPQHEPEEGWQVTNPDALTSLSSEMNAEHNEYYVKNVKLLRQTRRTLLGKRPGGLMVEMALYEAYRTGLVSGDSQAKQYVTGIEAVAKIIADYVDSGVEIPDPTLDGGVLSFRATDAQWQDAKDKFADAAIRARSALTESDLGLSAKGYADLLGGNDEHESVFPMPEGYNDDGTKRAEGAPLTPGDPHVPAGDSKFG